MRQPGRSTNQWPAFGLAGALHAAGLLASFVATVDLARTRPFLWVPVALGLVLLAAAETAALALANSVLERWLPPAIRRPLIDGLKAAALATLVLVPALSGLKLRATGVHLRRSDLWFAYSSWRQVLAEGTPREVALLAGPPLAWIALTLLFWWLLMRWRRPLRPAGTALAQLLAGLAGAVGSLLLLQPALARFVREVVPEAHWVVRGRPSFTALAAEETPGVGGRASGAPIAAYLPGAPERPFDVVLVMLESVSWPLVLERPEAAPNLLALAAEATLFPRAYAVSTHSDYAQMALLSSLHPRKYPQHDFYLQLAYPRTLLWDALGAAGYTTGLFSTQNERWGNMIRYLDTPGLDALRHAPDWPGARRRGEGVESKVFAETPAAEWRRWLDAVPDGPVFATLNFQATHFPYEAPPDAPRPFAPHALDFPATFVEYPLDKVPVMKNRFFNALAYADRWLGEVVDTLRATGRWERTLLAVASDHGEAFYEHGVPTHGTSLHEEQVRSLLVLRVPGRAPGTVEAPVSLLDVAPTVLSVLGLPPHGNFQGRGDILEPAYDPRGRAFPFTNQGIVDQDALLLDDWKLIVDHDRGTTELYDLASDPAETADLFAADSEHAASLAYELRRFLARQLGYYQDRLWERGLYPPPATPSLPPAEP
jgi:arylsulfatase A-like enzyme